MLSLDEIGGLLKGDKSSYSHDYLRHYEPFLEPLRLLPVKILEIGIGNGTSMKTWEEYFPHAQIVGMDIDNQKVNNLDGCQPEFSGRVIRVQGDQGNADDLIRVESEHGPFALIIDDASHHVEHQITSLCTLLPRVSPGGIYIMEDIFEQAAAGWLGNLCAGVGYWGREIAVLPRDYIESVSIFRGTAVLRRAR